MNEIEILLIEDNPGDARLAMEAMVTSKFHNRIAWVDTGEKALQYLFNEGDYHNVKTPDLLLMDLNLPGIGGHSILEMIKNNNKLKHIPVVILTSSDAEGDVLESYNQHANCYVKKPLDFHEFLDVIHSIDSFWLSIVELPKGVE